MVKKLNIEILTKKYFCQNVYPKTLRFLRRWIKTDEGKKWGTNVQLRYEKDNDLGTKSCFLLIIFCRLNNVKFVNINKDFLDEEVSHLLQLLDHNIVCNDKESDLIQDSLCLHSKIISPQEEFKKLYWLRWGVETFFSKIKGRLSLENFTGKTVESIKQDFWSTILISNIEAILTENVNEELYSNKNNNKYKQKVNKAVSLNAIKNSVFELFNSKQNNNVILKKLMPLYQFP